MLVVDDHPMMRDGIASALRAQPDMELVGEAGNGREAIARFRTLRPDVTLMDLNMPEMNGLDALHAIRNEFPDARIVVLTTYKGDVLAQRALKAGALGYLLKSSLLTDMVGAIRAARDGRRYVPTEIAVMLAENMGSEELSPREVEILKCVASGLSNKQIASQLRVSDETVKTHLKNAFAKLNVNDRSHAIAVAMSRGIFQL
ncbi:response regulator transcription factor [Povalibacter sp.]|uniref:response regulator transcription factor n=1 Tax=Povalibacter sp. TaxID=1962978 RepID=UPI002F3EF970